MSDEQILSLTTGALRVAIRRGQDEQHAAALRLDVPEVERLAGVIDRLEFLLNYYEGLDNRALVG